MNLFIPARLVDLENLTLERGSHKSWKHGACFLDMIDPKAVTA